ncbi:MAG: potassium/proton antiporter [Phycisphaeraceae bacterium]|nr:potassium/proton antiporter [Phycisphaeraceae bacterium]MCW5755085.1 potassium/proton antiporter [Phycisphaeraceae bacterium]
MGLCTATILTPMLGLTEPGTTAVVLLIFGILMCVSVLLSRLLDRTGIPVVLLFLLFGMIGGSEGLGGLEFDNHQAAFRIGTIALVLILLDGGLNTSFRAVRASLLPASILATVGVAGTAAVLALIGRLLGLGWPEAILIGAIVSSTDAAAVFAVLRGGRMRMRERLQNTIEVEACINDPMAVILTVAVIESVISRSAPSWTLAYQIPLQLVIGGGVGCLIGLGAASLLNRAGFATAGLVPVVTLGSAFVAFGLATIVNGSGFLAVFAAALVLGNRDIPYRRGIVRVHDAFAWLSQVSMFLMLGLLVFPSQLLPVAWVGLGLGLGLAFVARPLVVMACLKPLGYSVKHSAFIGWVGLRGAVPIVLATFPIMAGVPDADRIFHIVFFIVVVSTIIPGATLRKVTRSLHLHDPLPPRPVAAVEMLSLRRLNGEVRVYPVRADLVICNAKLRDIAFPEGAAAILIVRGNELLAARGNTDLLAGDHVYIFCRPEDEPQIGLLFGRPLDD